MGYDLYGKGGYFGCSNQAWYHCLDVACAFGWEPAGTRLPDGPPEAQGNPGADWKWDGKYNSNDWQIVTDDDAKAFAAALDRAIEAEKASTLTKGQRSIFDGPPPDPFWETEDGKAMLKKLEKVSGKPPSTSELLKELADFALQGSFRLG
jgi:hypothetical protein